MVLLVVRGEDDAKGFNRNVIAEGYKLSPEEAYVCIVEVVDRNHGIVDRCRICDEAWIDREADDGLYRSLIVILYVLDHGSSLCNENALYNDSAPCSRP